jgi:hypothetical protein
MATVPVHVMRLDWQRHYDADAVEPPCEEGKGDYSFPGLVVTVRYRDSLEPLLMISYSREETRGPQ